MDDDLQRILSKFNSRIDYTYASLQVNGKDVTKRVPYSAYSVQLGTNIYVGFNGPLSLYGQWKVKNARIAFYEHRDDIIPGFWIHLGKPSKQ